MRKDEVTTKGLLLGHSALELVSGENMMLGTTQYLTIFVTLLSIKGRTRGKANKRQNGKILSGDQEASSCKVIMSEKTCPMIVPSITELGFMTSGNTCDKTTVLFS